MKKMFFLIAAFVLTMAGVNQTQAVELLTSGDFETPGGDLGPVPGWSLIETLTGSSESVDTAELTGPPEDLSLFLKAFAGGGPLGPTQGNFDNDGLPAGDVDGRDFLTWQRNFGRTDALPADGDATEDMMVNGDDLSRWQSNYGANPAGRFTNARLLQTVPASAGGTYRFQGTSTFEDNYSGFVTTLGDASPHGQIPSPTTTQFKMEFLNSQGNVIPGSTTTLDLRTEQTFPGFPIVHTPLTAVAPAGTVNVRVAAEALNMAWNGLSTQETPGALQSAFFNDFSLTRDLGNDLLFNGDLNLAIPSALDFWNQVETPATRDEILRTAGFANHTPSGSLGVWYSAFFGAHASFEPTPVSGSISQTVEAEAGGTYNFSGWSRFEGGYSGGVDTICTGSGCTGTFAGMTSPTVTEIVLEFFDVDGVTDPNGPIATVAIDIKTDRRLQEDLLDDGLLNGTGLANDNQWREHTLEDVVAPAGTRFARLSATMTDAVFNRDFPGSPLGNQSMFFDDFTLDGPGGLIALFAVPEPTSAALIAFGLAAVGLRRGRRMS